MKDHRNAFLNAIRELSTRDADGQVISPTLENLCEAVGLQRGSKGYASTIIRELIAEGLVVKTREGPRCLAVVDLADRRLSALVAAAMRVTESGDPDLRAGFRQAFAETLARVG